MIKSFDNIQGVLLLRYEYLKCRSGLITYLSRYKTLNYETREDQETILPNTDLWCAKTVR